jgi:hypothetical protein
VIEVPEGSATWWNVAVLHPDSLYLVRLIAINAVGASRPTHRLRVKTDEESPEGVATDIKTRSNDSQSIHVTWKVMEGLKSLLYWPASKMTSHFSLHIPTFNMGI